MLEKLGPVRNPLTVIAFFAALAEVAATFALASMERDLQLVFMWFVMGFPTLLVVAFFLTLNFNAKSLYAPSDFKDEATFRMLHLAEQAQKKLKDVQGSLTGSGSTQPLLGTPAAAATAMTSVPDLERKLQDVQEAVQAMREAALKASGGTFREACPRCGQRGLYDGKHCLDCGFGADA